MVAKPSDEARAWAELSNLWLEKFEISGSLEHNEEAVRTGRKAVSAIRDGVDKLRIFGHLCALLIL